MATIDPNQLKADVETVLNDTESVLTIVDNFPLPAEVKAYITKAETVLKDVQSFLDA